MDKIRKLFLPHYHHYHHHGNEALLKKSQISNIERTIL